MVVLEVDTQGPRFAADATRRILQTLIWLFLVVEDPICPLVVSEESTPDVMVCEDLSAIEGVFSPVC